MDASAKPAAIDFEHAEGGLKGKTWKGIYVLDSETLTVCDNAENLDAARPSKIRGEERVWLCPGHVSSSQTVATGSVAASRPRLFALRRAKTLLAHLI